MLCSSTEDGRIVLPWPRHDNKDPTTIEEANEKLSTSLDEDSFLALVFYPQSKFI